MARRRGPRMEMEAEINVVPLIDVILLLMIIFMITAPMMQGGVDIVLPEAAVRPVEPKGDVVVSINRNGEIFVDRTQLSLNEFRAGFRSLAGNKVADGVSLRADQSVAYGLVVQVMAIMREAGVQDIAFVAEPEEVR
jgi:biopolymer transport protein TolR